MSRRKAERRGRVAEWLAMAYLMCKGYRILGHRLRTPYGEVDISAWKQNVLVIVEVKARNTYEAGVYAVTPMAAASSTTRHIHDDSGYPWTQSSVPRGSWLGAASR